MSEPTLRNQFFAVPRNSSLESLSTYGDEFARLQKSINWWIGDLARYAEARWPETWHQAFPEGISPGLVDRCKAVAKAYPNEEDRHPEATWSVHMQHASKPDRQQWIQTAVEAGRTSDEERKAQVQNRGGLQRWLLAVDVNYFLHRFWFSGAGVEAAQSVSGWVRRTVERLQDKGLTDCVCCFDDAVNHRKEFTANWEDKYKDRPPKDPELGHQLNMVRELLQGQGFACVSVPGMEGDDCMASYAKQFSGRVTLLTQDKDCRQCLSDSCNMLFDVEWNEDETSGEHVPEYKWLSAKAHTEATGIPPEQWTEFQCLMGDNVDGIKGASGIGEKGAADLVKEFGSVEAAIEAARNDDERIRPAKRAALIEFADKLEVTRQLVTLRTDLKVTEATRI